MIDVDGALAPGVVFHGCYEVIARRGAGGMGVVYEVRDTRTLRKRALKVLRVEEPLSAEIVRRFEIEATATADVQSPHVVEVLDAGVDVASGLPFLVMELLEGEDLSQRLKRGVLSWVEARDLLDTLASVLDEMHGRGIVHRDLKPENLFLAVQADGVETLKVLDFGAAKVLSASLKTTRALGSPLYMSPEALEGDAAIDGRADIYAMGHLAFTLLVGEALWERVWREARGYYAVLIKMMGGARVQPSARAAERGVLLPPGFDAWFAKATARDMGARFDTAGECAAAFIRVVEGKHSRGVRWQPLAAGAASIAVVVVGVAAARARTSASEVPPELTFPPDRVLSAEATVHPSGHRPEATVHASSPKVEAPPVTARSERHVAAVRPALSHSAQSVSPRSPRARPSAEPPAVLLPPRDPTQIR